MIVCTDGLKGIELEYTDGVRTVMTYFPFKYWKERQRNPCAHSDHPFHASLAALPPASQQRDSDCLSSSSCRTDHAFNLSLPATYVHSVTSERDSAVWSQRCHQCNGQTSFTQQPPGNSICSCSVITDVSQPPLLPVEESHLNICNIFWKFNLTFHPYCHGDALVDFSSLWPDGNQLVSLLLETYTAFGRSTSSQDLLFMAIRMGPLRVLKVMLQTSLIDINVKFDDGGGGLLHKACLTQNVPAALFLTSAGIDPSIVDDRGRTADQLCFTPQIQAALSDKYRQGSPRNKRRASLRRLTEVDVYSLPAVLVQKTRVNNIKKNVATTFDEEQMMTLAANPKRTDELLIMLQTLLVDVNAMHDDQGDHLVHVAVRHGLCQLPLLSILQRLFNADVNLVNQHGMAPLHIAAEEGDPLLVDSLVCVLGADPNVAHKDSGWTPLHYACHSDNENVISILIKRGADFNREDRQGARPDDVASLCGHQEAKELIQMHRKAHFQMLSEKTAQNCLSKDDLVRSDLFLTDEKGRTLIMIAAENNAVDSLRILLQDPQSPVDAQHEKTLRTSLAMAASLGHCEAVQVLMNQGASSCIKDVKGSLPLHDAIRGNHLSVIRLMLSHSEALTGLSHAYRLTRTQEASSEIKSAINRRQREIVTPALFECAMNGDAQRLFCLLEDGDNVNPSSGSGDWPLSLAVENGHLATVQLLVQWGADYSRTHPTTADTVLHMAAARGHYGVLRFLLKCIMHSPVLTPKEVSTAMVNRLNCHLQTPLVMAAERGYSQAVRTLLMYGATPAVLDAQGQLYQCDAYQGVQALLDQHRRKHMDAISACMQHRKGHEEIQGIFIPQFDHNLRDDNGNTPLMLACSLGRRRIVQVLLASACFSVAPTSTSSNSLESSTELFDSISDSVLSKPTNPPDRPSNQHQTNLIPESVDLHSAEDVMKAFINEESVTSVTASLSSPHPLPDGNDLLNNIPTLLNSIVSLHTGSVYTANYQVNHLCAVCPKDGATALHKLVTAGDRDDILDDILEFDKSVINSQDNEGCSPLHLACKFRRKKCVEKLVPLPYVDLNCRTLDGRLPEEMTEDQYFMRLIKRNREQTNSISSDGRRRCFSSLRNSWMSVSNPPNGTASSEVESHMDFEKLNSRFLMLKQQPDEYNSYM